MSSIPPKKLLEIARDVAFELGLPWRMGDLGENALDACESAKPPPGNLGLPPEQADEQTHWSIRRQVEKTGEGMDRLPFDQSEPTDNQIRVALLTFSLEQWRGLIDGFDQGDTNALLSYLHANRGPLENRLGYGNFGAIYEHAIRRHLILRWSQPGVRFVSITDALDAARIHKTARQRNIGRVPQPPQEPPWDEKSRPPFIAKKVSGPGRKVSRYKVDMMLKRMKENPPENFAGSIEDFLVWATAPEAYERGISAREASTKPPRKPDPYFCLED
jgi:hypothetical protein